MNDDTRAALDLPIDDSYWVQPGLLLAGEYPGHPRKSIAQARLGRLLAAGIRDFLDLTEDWELNPYTELVARLASRERTTVEYVRISIPDLCVPTPAIMSSILDAIDARMQAGRPTYLHCWGGVGRTGTVVGCWLVRHGATGPAALARIDEWWQAVPKRVRHPRSPETDEQRRFVLDWREAR